VILSLNCPKYFIESVNYKKPRMVDLREAAEQKLKQLTEAAANPANTKEPNLPQTAEEKANDEAVIADPQPQSVVIEQPKGILNFFLDYYNSINLTS
jgi:hypothetical protein